MNTLVPLEYYSLLYYYFMAIVVVFAYSQSLQVELADGGNLKQKNAQGVFILFAIFLYMGLRPISGRYFVDMATYNSLFKAYAEGGEIELEKDVTFSYFMKFCSMIMSVGTFFLLCAGLYIFPLYYACRKFFQDYWYYGFIMLVASMSFWAYGVNGIRNGIATSFFLFALSREKKFSAWLLIALSVMIHKSLMIPTVAYAVSLLYTNTRAILVGWFFSIPLSLAFGKAWEVFFMSFGLIENERVGGYFADDELGYEIVNSGFRWDFLIYSASAVYAGWYFIIKKNFKDPLYSQIFNIYLIANAFWVLVIRAGFSNRFAYLSWFLMGVVIIYPLLKVRFFPNQHRVVGFVVLIYFVLTFLLNVILG